MNLLKSKLVLLLIGCSFCFASTYYVVLTVGRAIPFIHSSQWKRTAATIVQSGIDVDYLSGGEIASSAVYELFLKYEYMYDGVSYIGKVVSPFPFKTNWLPLYEKKRIQFQKGSIIIIYVNPKQPERATIYPLQTVDIVLQLSGPIMLFLCGFGCLLMVRRKSGWKHSRSNNPVTPQQRYET